MPYSTPTFDDELQLYFREVHHNCVLDIGPGEGKYARMLRRLQADIRLIAVEVDPDYVERYKLRELYDEVWVLNAVDLIDNPDHTFDAVIIGDCIEHMRKSMGLDLLNFLVYRAKLMP